MKTKHLALAALMSFALNACKPYNPAADSIRKSFAASQLAAEKEANALAAAETAAEKKARAEEAARVKKVAALQLAEYEGFIKSLDASEGDKVMQSESFPVKIFQSQLNYASIEKTVASAQYKSEGDEAAVDDASESEKNEAKIAALEEIDDRDEKERTGACVLFNASDTPLVSANAEDTSLLVSAKGKAAYSTKIDFKSSECKTFFGQKFGLRLKNEYFTLHVSFYPMQ